VAFKSLNSVGIALFQMNRFSIDNNSTLLILGMHRSGTSSLAGSLQAAGLNLGRSNDWNEHNRRGNKENQTFVVFNERILRQNGGSWDSPPDTIEWSARQRARALELVAEFSDSPRWGFKDPRTLLVLEGWQQCLDNLQLVATFRHPLAVVRSLSKRNKMPAEKVLSLWNYYNNLLLQEYDRKPFPVIHFGVDVESYCNSLNRLILLLRLQPLPSSDQFFTPDLVNQEVGSEDAKSKQSLEIYERLRAIAL
jgi:hypothetical protein